MEPQDNDNFSFDELLSDESKKELGIESQPTVETTTETPVVETKTEEIATPEVKENTQEEVQETTSPDAPEANKEQGAPTRAANEPEWKYNYRVELWEKQQALKAAGSESEKKQIRQDMSQIRKDMADTAKSEDYGDIEPDKIAQVVKQQLAYERQIETIDRAENDFLKRHPDIRISQDKYDFLTNYVAETYILAGKSYSFIINALESAYSDLFPSNLDTKQQKAQEVQKKVDAADFSGSSAPVEVDAEKEESKNLVKNIKENSGNDFGWAID